MPSPPPTPPPTPPPRHPSHFLPSEFHPQTKGRTSSAGHRTDSAPPPPTRPPPPPPPSRPPPPPPAPSPVVVNFSWPLPRTAPHTTSHDNITDGGDGSTPRAPPRPATPLCLGGALAPRSRPRAGLRLQRAQILLSEGEEAIPALGLGKGEGEVKRDTRRDGVIAWSDWNENRLREQERKKGMGKGDGE